MNTEPTMNSLEISMLSTESQMDTAAPKPDFATALEVVKERMLSEASVLPSALDDISFEAKRNFENGVDFRWSFWVGLERYFGQTIDEARAQLMTPQQKAAKRLAQIQAERIKMDEQEASLLAELAKLEKEEGK